MVLRFNDLKFKSRYSVSMYKKNKEVGSILASGGRLVNGRKPLSVYQKDYSYI